MTLTAEFTNRVDTVAALLSELTGERWQVDREFAQREPGYPGLYLVNRSHLHRKLYVRTDWRNENMTAVTGCYPPGSGEHAPSGGLDDCEIKVSTGRGPQAIAKAINARLLPKYLPLIAAVLDAKRTAEVHKASRSDVAALLADVAGVDRSAIRADNRKASFGLPIGDGPWGRVEVGYYASTVYLELREVSPELADKILGLVKAESMRHEPKFV